MTQVYRIENKQGYGCYARKGIDINELHHHNGTACTTHPHPSKDIGIKRFPKPEERHGFLNLKQVYNWFTKGEIARMKNNGYHLKKLLVKEITEIGEMQILFIK